MNKRLLGCMLFMSLQLGAADQQQLHVPGLVYSHLNPNVLVGSNEWLDAYQEMFMSINHIAQQFHDEVVSQEAGSAFVHAILSWLQTDIGNLIDAYQDFDENPDLGQMIPQDALTLYDQYEFLRNNTGQDLLNALADLHDDAEALGGDTFINTVDLLENFMQDAYQMGDGAENLVEVHDDDNAEAMEVGDVADSDDSACHD